MNKKAQELATHDKDTGSSEIQIALLTEKIETLSKHIKRVLIFNKKNFITESGHEIFTKITF